jgi:hypothetical protein
MYISNHFFKLLAFTFDGTFFTHCRKTSIITCLLTKYTQVFVLAFITHLNNRMWITLDPTFGTQMFRLTCPTNMSKIIELFILVTPHTLHRLLYLMRDYIII